MIYGLYYESEVLQMKDEKKELLKMIIEANLLISKTQKKQCLFEEHRNCKVLQRDIISIW